MDQIMTLFIVLLSIIALESLVLIFSVWKTPMLTFLKASFLKQPIMYIIGKDRLGKFKTFKPENGAGKAGKDGLFHLTDNSHTLEMGSKTPLYIAFRDLAATLLPEYPAIIQELREQGVIVNNIEDIDDYIRKIKKGIKQDLPISVKPYKTYKMHDLENMFPQNLDPTFIDSTVQCEIAKAIKLSKSIPTMIGGLVVFILVSALAVYIIKLAFANSIPAATCTQMISAAKCNAGALSNQMMNLTIR